VTSTGPKADPKTDSATGADPDDGEAAPGVPRRSRRAVAAAIALTVLLVAGIVVGTVAVNHNADAPLAAVRAYVDAIARGDAAAANAAVDPRHFADGVDRALLTDDVLGSAAQRIVVRQVDLNFDADIAADVVKVDVTYDLGNTQTSVVLRAKRAGTTAGLLHDWRVIDPLLVPVRVETNEARLDTASLGGATVPVSGPVRDGFPERHFFVYPAIYELRGHESRYLTAAPNPVVATGRDFEERPADTDTQTAEAQLSYRATPELVKTVTGRLATYVADCVARAPDVPPNCPYFLDAYADFATNIRLHRQPTLDSIQSYQVDYRPDGTTKPSLRFAAGSGSFSYVGSDGEDRNQEFSASGRIVVTPDDDLTVTFTGSF
jgi:hypothetical protein